MSTSHKIKVISLALSLTIFMSVLSAVPAVGQQTPLGAPAQQLLKDWQKILQARYDATNDSLFYRWFGLATVLDLKQTSEKKLSPDFIKIKNAFQAEGTGWKTCVLECEIHVSQGNLKAALATIDHILAQNEKDEKAIADRDRAAQAAATAENERQANGAKLNLQLIASNKNNRQQLPAILGDWYLPQGQYGAETIRLVAAPNGNIEEQTCRDDSYWLSGRRLCIVSARRALYFSAELNGFCSSPDQNSCDLLTQVSNRDASRYITIQSPLDKLAVKEEAKTSRSYQRIDQSLPNPQNYPMVPDAVATMNTQESSLLGAWVSPAAQNGQAPEIFFVNKASLGMLEVLKCNPQVWNSTSGKRCDNIETPLLYYYQPQAEGYCRADNNCRSGMIFRDSKLVVTSDPLGTNRLPNSGSTIKAFSRFTKPW